MQKLCKCGIIKRVTRGSCSASQEAYLGRKEIMYELEKQTLRVLKEERKRLTSRRKSERKEARQEILMQLFESKPYFSKKLEKASDEIFYMLLDLQDGQEGNENNQVKMSDFLKKFDEYLEKLAVVDNDCD